MIFEKKNLFKVYDLGEDGLSTSCVAQLRLDSIQRKARDIASGMEPSNLNEIIHIAPITRHESRHMHLVAVTQSGLLLFQKSTLIHSILIPFFTFFVAVKLCNSIAASEQQVLHSSFH